MKKLRLLPILAVTILQSCGSSESAKVPTITEDTAADAFQASSLTADEGYSLPIPIDTANRMISSYLTGVHYPPSNTYLRSLLFNADTLRNYLADTSNGRIANIRLMLAHQLGWINTGHYGQNGSTKSAALTLILVGLDAQGRYIYNRNNMVYEHMQPCPYHCPENTPDILTR